MPKHEGRLRNHECARFWALGLNCPFRKLDDLEDESPPDEEFFRDVGVGHRKSMEQRGDQLKNNLLVLHAQPEMRKILERMAAIQFEGGLPSIPKAGELMGSPSGGLGRPELVPALAAIAIGVGLGMRRSSGSRPSMPAVRASERGAAKLLSGPLGTSRLRGRGGFHVNAAAAIQAIQGGRGIGVFPKRRLKDRFGFGLPGFDSFSETGFF